MLRFFISALTVLSPLFVFAQAKVDATKPLRLEYSSKSWNKNPNLAETWAVIMRDAKSKKIVRVVLEETQNNSSVFVGSYSVSWGDNELLPEIYIAPQDMIKTNEQLKRFEVMIKEGVLLRKPYFVRVDAKSNQVLTVFDTKEQALQALEEYRRVRLQVNTPVDRAAMEAEANAAKAAAQKAAELLAQKQVSERLRMEEEEKKRQEELKRQSQALEAAEKARRQALAKKAAEEGLRLFQEGKFAESETQFQKATELDPGNTSFYYKYGVALYKTEKYNRSMVFLDLAQGNDINPTEREYYKSLNRMKMNELDSALSGFQSVKKTNDKALSPSAAFFAGVINFQQEKFDDAKADFEYTLDNSSDPAMDKQAEAFIEQIANAMAFKKEQSKRLILTFNLGLMYDSNILSVANSQLDQPTDLEGFRWSYGGTAEYRFHYTARHEFSAVLTAGDMYSQDSKFQANENFQKSDPLTSSLYLPYKYKGQALGKGYQLTLSPGYEIIQMDTDGDGSRAAIINSTVLKNDHTFVMSNDWFSTYALEARNDKSLIDSSASPDDDLTATKVGLSTTQSYFMNSKKTEAWIGEFGASQNTAAGKNSTYTRIDLAATYMAPWKWETTWTARLGLYNANYSQHTTGRQDTNIAAVLGLRKPFSESLSASVTGIYTINQSTYEASDYKKYIIMTGLSWTGFL